MFLLDPFGTVFWDPRTKIDYTQSSTMSDVRKVVPNRKRESGTTTEKQTTTKTINPNKTQQLYPKFASIFWTCSSTKQVVKDVRWDSTS